MRIITGRYRGKHIIAPRGLPARPTTDFAKEALFNLIGNRFSFDEISVLDLFSGTGNISFEFASRGCTDIISVDVHPASVKFVHSIAQELDFEGLKSVRSNAFEFVQRAYRSWDVIFADPPYDYNGYEELIDAVFGSPKLNEGGVLILEHAKTTDLSAHEHFEDSRKYGNVHFSFFSKTTVISEERQ